MRITFPDEAPIFDGANLAMRFVAQVDGEPVVCAISAEALEDHFGAGSPLEDELRAAFERGWQQRIRPVCEAALEQNEGAGVVLHSGLFRVDGA